MDVMGKDYMADNTERRIKIDCKAGMPVQLTAELMSKRLHSIGLNCKSTNPDVLNGLIKEVENQLPDGKNEAFGIYVFNSEKASFSDYSLSNFEPTLECPFVGASGRINSSWVPSVEALGYMEQLFKVIIDSNFKVLKEHFADFVCCEKPETTTTKEGTTEEMIKSFFAETLTAVFSCMFSGISVVDIKAMCTGMIAPMLRPDDNYSVGKNFVIFLLKNYDGYSADAIGAISFKFLLEITNYKEKKSDIHKTTLTLSARSVIYDDLNVLEKHVKYVEQR